MRVMGRNSKTPYKSSSEDENGIPDLYKVKFVIESEIDDYMREIGISNPERYTNEDGWRIFQRGSASIFVGVRILDDYVVLMGLSKIMDLPSDKDLILPLMRELLELNVALPNEGRFGIKDNNVIITVSKFIAEYGENMVPFCLDLISKIADDYDDYLIQKYGGTSRKRN